MSADFDHIVKAEVDEQHLKKEKTSVVLINCNNDDSITKSSKVAVKEELDKVEKSPNIDQMVKHEIDKKHLRTEETIVFINNCNNDLTLNKSSEVAVKKELDEVEKNPDVNQIVKVEIDFETEDSIVSINCNYSHYAEGGRIKFEENVKNNSLGLLNLQTKQPLPLSVAPTQFLPLGSDKLRNELKVVKKNANFDHIVKDEMDEQHFESEEAIVLMNCNNDDSNNKIPEVAVKEELDEVEKSTDVDHIVKHEMDFEAEDSIVSISCNNDYAHYAEVEKIEFEENESTINIDIDNTGNNYECDLCNKKYETKSILSRHLKRHMTTPTGEKPYSCKTCDKTFNCSNNLHSHTKRIHSAERRYYSCNRCNKTLASMGSLKRHMRLHTGEKPYSCDRCDEAFAEKRHLQKHMQIHTGVRLYYPCNICNKTLVTSNGLRNHMRIHSGEKPYACNSCDKTFVTSSGLANHKRIHTVEKSFSCNMCNKAFALNEYLQKHVLRRHSEEKPYSRNPYL